MKIHKMTASFGRLKNDSLALGDGLNIICAPNESGKSTWCGFIKAMLYGIDSAAREKAGVKPDKLRFAPWSGAPMAGAMEIEYAGEEITLLRKGKESAPMRDFSAVLTGTSTPYRGLEAASVGETLTGVSKDVFERSAFIGQGKLAVGASPELEKRIAALVQTGEESGSASEAEERLKAALRRRRFNRIGRLPEVERALDEIREGLAEGEREAEKGEALKRARAAALERRNAALEKLAEARKAARRETLEKLSESRRVIKALEDAYFERAESLNAVKKGLEAGIFGSQTPEEAKARVEGDRERLRALSENALKGGGEALNYSIFAVLILAAVAFELLADFKILNIPGLAAYLPRIIAGVLALAQLARIFALRKKRKGIQAGVQTIYAQYGCGSLGEINALLEVHEKRYAGVLDAEEEKKAAADTLEEAKQAQAELEAMLLKDLDFTEGESEAVRCTQLLEEAEAALRSIREESAAWEGRQTALGDPEELKKRQAELLAEHEKLSEEYDALSLALETLRSAGEEISHRVTPRLSARTAELFSGLSDARYDAVLLDRELRAVARPQGDSVPRDADFLSAGALDQLYLAVRLALCELALPEDKSCPLILDDALVNFDDARCKSALELLRDLARDRQILLFTCHRREAELVAGLDDVQILEI